MMVQKMCKDDLHDFVDRLMIMYEYEEDNKDKVNKEQLEDVMMIVAKKHSLSDLMLTRTWELHQEEKMKRKRKYGSAAEHIKAMVTKRPKV